MDQRRGIDGQVGLAVHRLRRGRGLTVSALARQAAVSPAMISRIEKGRVSPSLATLSALAEALSVPVMALLAQVDDVADVYHVRAGEGLSSRRVTPGHAHDYRLLGKHAGPTGSFQAARIRIERKDAGTLPSYQHEGHVFLQMLAGEAEYQCGDERFWMAVGDTLTFDAKLPHGFTQIAADFVEFVTVSTQPH